MSMDLQRLTSLLRQTITRYGMISPGDRIAVGLSGGKDSLTLLLGLKKLQACLPTPFDLCAIHVDSGSGRLMPDYDGPRRMAEFCAALGVPFTNVKTDIYDIVFVRRREKNPCSLCAKLRKGALNAQALALGCNKVAYAHHQDDFIETSLMSLLIEGHYRCFPPVTALDRTGLRVIRPMLLVTERDVIGFARKMALPVVQTPCPADGRTKRQEVKEFIRASRGTFPQIRENLFSALVETYEEDDHAGNRAGRCADNQPGNADLSREGWAADGHSPGGLREGVGSASPGAEAGQVPLRGDAEV